MFKGVEKGNSQTSKGNTKIQKQIAQDARP
jgi:hypothetical protein